MDNPANELLNLGVQELYDVGRWMRKHYSHFLPLKYDANDIYVQSIDFNRCLMSAEALLAALYPPVGEERWNRNLLWQPVPIHTTLVRNDIMLQWTACPYYTLNSRKALALKYKIKKENAKLFEYLSKETGSEVDLHNILLLYNVLKGEEMIHLPMPIWTRGIIKDITPLVEVEFQINSLDKALKTLRAGTLVHRMLRQFERAVSGRLGEKGDTFRKFMLYSTADMPIYYLADSLGVRNLGLVTYGFSMYYELRRDVVGDHYVDVFFRNSTDVGSETYEADVRGYEGTMRYEVFRELAEKFSISPEGWLSLCADLTAGNSTKR
ncbi:testicular acid phosphatase homolog isoform X2 [Harmonia axyridis]|nr:testicular acid phosphatase homolog isoform X2 [Harmonia axyridis]XP_045483306.1 testicular acid phosphatase homolog isoform X2 [Harmonia axyridis]